MYVNPKLVYLKDAYFCKTVQLRAYEVKKTFVGSQVETFGVPLYQWNTLEFTGNLLSLEYNVDNTTGILVEYQL